MISKVKIYGHGGQIEQKKKSSKLANCLNLPTPPAAGLLSLLAKVKAKLMVNYG